MKFFTVENLTNFGLVGSGVFLLLAIGQLTTLVYTNNSVADTIFKTTMGISSAALGMGTYGLFKTYQKHRAHPPETIELMNRPRVTYNA